MSLWSLISGSSTQSTTSYTSATYNAAIAKLEGRHVSVSSACIASGAPTTTALRLVNRLVSESILCRIPDEKDGRRDFLVIDPAIEEPLVGYLNELAKAN